MEAVVFYISAVVILGGGIGVITLKNPVHAALSLVATLFGVAIQFINLEAYFIAVVQVIVYAGAIVVLFLFVIMLLGVDRTENVAAEPIIGQRQFAVLAGVGLLALAIIVGVAGGAEVTGIPSDEARLPPIDGGLAIQDFNDTDSAAVETPSENVQEIGRALFSTRYVFAFEITGILLTIAVVGAVILARRPSGELEPLPDVERSWALRPDPEPMLEPDDDDITATDEADADADADAEVADTDDAAAADEGADA